MLMPTRPLTCSLVPEDRRLDFLPAQYGQAMLVVEHSIYSAAGHVIPDYRGGMWDFFEISNGGGFMAPQRSAAVRMEVPGNGYSGEMSAQAAGIVVTLTALSHLSMRYPQWAQEFSDRFHQLREFALDHCEQPAIFAAID